MLLRLGAPPERVGRQRVREERAELRRRARIRARAERRQQQKTQQYLHGFSSIPHCTE